MRKLVYPLILTALYMVCSTSFLSATHFMGVDITYECIGPCTYRVYHKTYYDCTGGAMSAYIPITPGNIPGPGVAATGNVNFTTQPGCPGPTPIGGWTFVSWDEVTPLCPNALNPPPGTLHPTFCKAPTAPGAINGVAELVYYQDYNFCNVGPGCEVFNITWSSCCRNSSISSGAADEGIYTGSTTIDLGITPCNSSPVFTNKPVPYICEGQPFTFNQGAFDPDGDSLAYELGPCERAAATPVSYNAGYTPVQPLGQTWDVIINPLTGDVTMTPNPTGNQVTIVICIVVKEYRNGVLIGQVTRDMQVTVIPTCNVPNPITAGVQNINIGANSVPADPISFGEVKTCPGTEICFDIPVISQDPTFTYTISWNQGIAGATFTDAFNPAVTNSITGPAPTGRFCWTPPTNADGAYFFVVSVNDDACPIPGFNQFTVIVYVEDVLAQSDAVADPISCNEVELYAFPISTIPSQYNNVFTSYNWSGNGNLQFNPNLFDSSFVHYYPQPAPYFYTLDLVDTFGCSITINGLVDLTTGVTADAGPDLTLCSNFVTPLGTPTIAGQTYKWTPSIALDDSTMAQPTFTSPNNGQVQASYNYILETTDGICTTFDYVTVNVNPSLEATISPQNSTICRGDSIWLFASSNISAGNTFQWSNGITADSIKVAPETSTTLSVVTFNNGCSSTPTFVTVNVTEGPDAQIGGDFSVCPGAATTLTAGGGADSYLWSVGNFQGSSITLPDINSPASVYLIGYDVNGCPGDTAFANISLEPTPTANFGVDVVCQGNITTFSDSSLSNVSPIASWNWDFDDNTPIDVNVNPNHTFTNAGSFDVSLVVTAQNGCRDTLTRNVAVRPSPQVDFTFTNVCEGLPNILTDNSTISAGGLITEYYWDFGDNSPQGAGSVVNHTFPGSGYYNVTHTVSSDNGCSNEFTKTVFVHPNPIADFDVISACINGVVLASTSSTVDGSLDFIQTHDWNFGDPGSGANNQSNETNPTHVYGSAQVYTVSLTVTTGNGCSDTEAKPVTVYPDPVADFVVDDRCENQNTQFTNTSTADPQTPIVTYAWDYGNGDNSAGRDGSQFYGNRPGPGVYPVSLTVETDQGCANTEVKNVRIFPAPEPQFVADPVCFGEPTLFENQSNVFTGDIISWSWDFGSNGQVSADSTPSFTYNAPGTYGVSLIARTDSGCENIFSREITVYELPEILEVRDATVCFGDVATLLVTADPSVTINWFYGPTGGAPFHQGFAYTTPPLPVPTTFYVEPQSEEGCINGRREVNVNLFNDEAMEMESSADVVEMPVAIVNFNTVSSIQIVNWSWNFGDDNTSAEASPAHEFQYPGKYRVTVVTEDENGCELTDSKVIEVKKIVNVSLPSAFSPNGDGFNDLFRIGHYKLGTFNIAIFNRWGQKVFESDNPDFTWNGKGPKGDDLQEGVYVYQLMATDFEGKEIKESRTITLVR